jgi:hypothetical protein
MAFKPPIRAGKPYRVSYDSSPTSGGTTLLRVLWIPIEDSAVERGTVISVSGDFGILGPHAAAGL